jgi:hypothetical protein
MKKLKYILIASIIFFTITKLNAQNLDTLQWLKTNIEQRKSYLSVGVLTNRKIIFRMWLVRHQPLPKHNTMGLFCVCR